MGASRRSGSWRPIRSFRCRMPMPSRRRSRPVPSSSSPTSCKNTDTTRHAACAAALARLGRKGAARSPIPSAASPASVPSSLRLAKPEPTGGRWPKSPGGWALPQAFDFACDAEIFAEHAALSAFENDGDRDFDIGAYAGMQPSAYDELQPFQWPQPAGQDATRDPFLRRGRLLSCRWQGALHRRQAGRV